MKISIFIFTLFLSMGASAGEAQDRNKKVVADFFELAFNQHKPLEATQKYMGPYYIQHNPYAASGAKAFVKFFEEHFKKNPKYKVIIKRLIAEGDYVVVHNHAKNDDSDLGRAIVDIMRLENGKIVEHFDVVQPVPAKTVSGNTMFEGNIK